MEPPLPQRQRSSALCPEWPEVAKTDEGFPRGLLPRTVSPHASLRGWTGGAERGTLGHVRRQSAPSGPTQLPGCTASDREPMSGCRAPPRRRALAEGAGWRPCCSRYSRCCARWELHLPTPLTSCCAVARPRAVRAREEGLQGAQYRLVAGSCSAAARLRPPVAGRPARTAAGFGRPCRPRVCCSRSERGGRSPAP